MDCEAGDRLHSWKEIADYLKRNVRTVQRWEKEEALPVRRLFHRKRSSVYASKSQLDAWWSGRRERVERTGFKPTRLVWVAAGLAGLFLLALEGWR